MKYIYKIGNLTCRYKDKDTDQEVDVLDVEDVSIVRGEITIILGPSGSGKSTFMEAISLMSDTINRGNSKDVVFYPEDNQKEIDLLELNKQNGNLQKLRFDNFSFIFQDTNIMGNFDPRENVALPKMVKEPLGAIEKAEDILRDHLNLKLDLTKKAGEYSGGQKQRFAFARAFMAKGSILFGDEPTGNLDKYNSEKLFWVIKKHIKKEKELNDNINKVGAIIVTHSIELALQFADRIIVIVKPEKFENITKEKISTEKMVVRGYVNPFLVYNNFKGSKWREDTECLNLEKNDYLPLIDDDGSNRFRYLSDTNGKQIKEKLKREIIFFLNNSYAVAQRILVEFAKELNVKLQELNIKLQKLKIEENLSTEEMEEMEEIEKKISLLFIFFEQLKTKILEYVDIDSGKSISVTDFEEKLFPRLKDDFTGNSLYNELIDKVEVECNIENYVNEK